MHWLPLVAMVIASALPFPHNPVSDIAATTKPGYDPAVRLAAPPVDYDSRGNVSQTDAGVAVLSRRTNGQNLHNPEDYVKLPEHEETSHSHSDSGGVGSDVPSGTIRAEDVSQENSAPQDLRADGGRRRFARLTDDLQDSTETLQVSTVENYIAVSPATHLKGQRGPGPTAPSVVRTPGAGLDAIVEADNMFLDMHPRVLFSPSLSPPEHPPLLLMMEAGQLEDDVDAGEELEDMDAHVEGHGDRAIDRSAALSWVDFPRVGGKVAQPVKRDKRSHLMDQRRGERSVCESESVWVTDKMTAIDLHGHQVTVLQEIQTQTGPVKQYFYETRCRQSEQPNIPGRAVGGRAAGGRAARTPGVGLASAGCLGVDKKQWQSVCKARQSYVRALTKDANNRMGWRWIRIDSSCVCVLLSRTNQVPAREVLMRGGRG